MQPSVRLYAGALDHILPSRLLFRDELRISRAMRFISLLRLELVAAHAAVDGNHGAGDVARPRRGEEAGEVRHILGLAVFAERNVLTLLLRAPLGTVVAPDLLAVDATGRNAVHGDAVFSDFARQALGPRMHRRLRGEGAVQALGLGLARDVDDAAPFARDHLVEQKVRELAMAAEIERQRFLPLLVGRLEREAPAGAGGVHEGVELPEAGERGARDALGRLGGEEVLLDDDELARLVLQLLEQRVAARDHC